jgi:hypothetical protein
MAASVVQWPGWQQFCEALQCVMSIGWQQFCEGISEQQQAEQPNVWRSIHTDINWGVRFSDAAGDAF